jgi:hypothetical protein
MTQSGQSRISACDGLWCVRLDDADALCSEDLPRHVTTAGLAIEAAVTLVAESVWVADIAAI